MAHSACAAFGGCCRAVPPPPPPAHMEGTQKASRKTRQTGGIHGVQGGHVESARFTKCRVHAEAHRRQTARRRHTEPMQRAIKGARRKHAVSWAPHHHWASMSMHYIPSHFGADTGVFPNQHLDECETCGVAIYASELVRTRMACRSMQKAHGGHMEGMQEPNGKPSKGTQEARCGSKEGACSTHTGSIAGTQMSQTAHEDSMHEVAPPYLPPLPTPPLPPPYPPPPYPPPPPPLPPPTPPLPPPPTFVRYMTRGHAGGAPPSAHPPAAAAWPLRISCTCPGL